MENMPPPIKPAKLVDGPLAGQEYRPVTRWHHYLDAEGKPMTVKNGDRIMSGRVQGSCYILCRNTAGEPRYEWREAQA